ncbi:uncharacterized protein LOC116215483 [Punica granatum]|uniref:Uncharacterized protein n=2 Tax=Punica granatum TaxID=22663 RepID=A0A218VUB1_PUNGR|nr:uncharacterized protein LOC116215483 [Punica granatum]OWM63798.1 hypothetical protein CDL15_Pgr006060 [Punica granatum]PKI42209.1 hypothetical protein CRG98_037389 [Punica granatum]
MPLPWKKKSRSSSARISRLVADLQSPPKRGGSLVVQTGFPTSLIDLFVKNRDRLKKSSKKTKHSDSRDRPDTPAIDSTPLDPPTHDPRLTSPAEDHAGPALELLADIPEGQVEGGDREFQTEGVRGFPIVAEVPDRGGLGGSCRNRVSSVVWMVFTVVVLALCTKGFVMGITISTAVLLLLEHISKEIPRARRAREIRNYRSKREAFIFEGTEEWHFAEEEIADGGRDSVSPPEGIEGHDESNGEIEALKPETPVLAQNDSLGLIPSPELLRRESSWGSLDAEPVALASAVQGTGDEGTKKKSKIMKRIIVPMKLRNQAKRKG